jgi:DNA repair protein RadC
MVKNLLNNSLPMKQYNNLPIKEWALEDRPREKLMTKGISSLSSAELLAIIIGSGTRSDTAVELSKKLLNLVGNNLHELGKLDLTNLKKIHGIGPAKAMAIIACFELGKRRNSSSRLPDIKISGSKDVFDLFQPFLGDLPHEEFWILLLNRANRVIDKIRISQGGISGTIIDTRIILKNAVDRLASTIILCHNHPSGNLKPSDADIRITSKMKESSQLMDINLIDHIIIADNTYFSFADEGII